MKKFGYFLLLVLVVIQFFRPQKNIDAAPSAIANNVSKIYPVPENVQDILKISCYDCHSNNTVYPWYNNIQPVAWWLNNHINEGRGELNFDEFATYPARRQYRKMEEVIDEVKEDKMPLSSYTLIHKDAKLNQEQKNAISDWAEGVRKQLEAKYPPDSLKRKQ